MKYSARLIEKIRRLYKEEEEELDKIFISNKRGIISAVQISSRISALARVSINKYKILQVMSYTILILIH